MTLPRQDIVAGYPAELERFEELLRSLDDEDWKAPTRCEGWTVGDVAAHVVGTLADITAGRFDRIGAPGATQIPVDERKGSSPAELADELQQVAKAGSGLLAAFDDAAWNGPAPGAIPGTVGGGVEALWYDTYVHGDDIRTAVGRPYEPGDGIRPSIEHIKDFLENAGWGPATLELKGFGTVEVGGGPGPTITADPWQFVLVATGRQDPSTLGLDETVNIYR